MKENITNIDTSVNDRLKEIREYLELTQTEFARVLEVKQSYYSDVENGKREVTSKLIKNLVFIYRFSANWILTGEGEVYITKVDSSIDKKSANFDINRKINSNSSPGIYKNSSTLPFYLDLHIDKKILIELLNSKSQEGRLYNDINNFTTFSYIIESIDREYFSGIKSAEKNRDVFFKDHKFDYESFKESVFDEVRKVMKFKPALDKVNLAIEEFYKEFNAFDETNLISGFFGRELNNKKQESANQS